MSSDLELRSILARMYAHDFRNPLAAISANLSFLEASIDEADLREAATEASLALQQLLFLIDNYVLISRLEAGESTALEEVRFDEFVRSAVERCQKRSVMSNVSLVVSQPVPPVSCTWPMAYARLAVDNLLLSSVAHARDPGEVTLTGSVQEDMAILIVTDDGGAIHPSYLPCSFDAAFQSQAKTLSDARYSRGMGMYAIHLAAQGLGGSIEALPGAGNEQSFRLAFPVQFASSASKAD
jgi:signal transduction histidine kinase